MIRYLSLLIGLVIGFGTVLAVEGRMHHLRRFAASAEPNWANDFSDASGVFSGETGAVPLAILPVTTRLNWRFDHLDQAGAVWRAALVGDGIAGQGGALRLLLQPGTAAINHGKGEISLALLPQVIAGLRAGGALVIKDVQAGFSYPNAQISRLEARVQWIGARIDGQEIGQGELSITSGSAGGWRAPFAVSGDVIRVTGQLQGRFDLPQATLEITIEDAGAMPDSWKRALGQQVPRGEDGWTLRREVNLTDGWPIF